MDDKFSATWVSHSSIGDYLKCPRAYYLNNVYKDPKTGNKITLMSPPLALGQAVHQVLESLSILPTDQRFQTPLMQKFEQAWSKISGEKGGFLTKDTENRYKQRGIAMINRVQNHPGPLQNLAVKINMDLPHYWLSQEDNIILCGKIDWLEYLPDTDSVHIIDFKTGKSKEDDDSLQLPIYTLLVHNCQNRKAEKASYWYLETNNTLTQKPLPDLEKSHQKILKIAKQIKLSRSLGHFKCPQKNGCFACRPLEKIINRKAKYVGTNDYRNDVYILTDQSKPETSSTIL
jgi:ATP-dependent helicase/DNAse subunit B